MYLTQWLATLPAVGVCPVELLRCGAWLFNEALVEKGRPEYIIEVYQCLTLNVISVEQMFPLCEIWLRENSHRLAILSADPPELDEEACISYLPDKFANRVTDSSFSVESWKTWRAKLHELAYSRDRMLAPSARECIRLSNRAGRWAGVVLDDDIVIDEIDTEESEEGMESDEPDTERLQDRMASMSVGANIQSIGSGTASSLEMDMDM